MLKSLFKRQDDRPFDALTATESWASHLPNVLPKDGIRRKALDVLLNVGIPFNRWLGLKIHEISKEQVVIESPPSVLRRNHVGTAHACAQALLGEYPAGLVVAQHFPMESYRFIISKLEIEYFKPGRGTLHGTAKAPASWPDVSDGEGWVDMVTEITNEKGEHVSSCKTRWQVKSWDRIKTDKAARTSQA